MPEINGEDGQREIPATQKAAANLFGSLTTPPAATADRLKIMPLIDPDQVDEGEGNERVDLDRLRRRHGRSRMGAGPDGSGRSDVRGSPEASPAMRTARTPLGLDQQPAGV